MISCVSAGCRSLRDFRTVRSDSADRVSRSRERDNDDGADEERLPRGRLIVRDVLPEGSVVEVMLGDVDGDADMRSSFSRSSGEAFRFREAGPTVVAEIVSYIALE